MIERLPLSPLLLPSLRDLRIFVNTHHTGGKFFGAVVDGTASSLRSITLVHGLTTLPDIIPFISASLTSAAPHILHLTCEPIDLDVNEFDGSPTPHDQGDLLKLLGTMFNLEPLSILLHPDPLFFATLRTLPSLVTLRLSITSHFTAAEVAASLASATFKHLELTIVSR